MGKFQGFDVPKQNFFRLPNNWTDLTARMRSWGEHKVVEYVLRHTWGFSEYGIAKKITLDEFENGRKTKHGRMDAGVGASKPTIISGLKQAIEDGLLIREVDDSDRGRVKHSYRLRMTEDGERTFTPDVKSVDNGCKEDLHRTEKDTIRKTPLSFDKERGDSRAAPRAKRHKVPTPAKELLLTDWDRKGGRRLREVLIRHDSDLVHTTNNRRGVRSDTLAKTIFRLRDGRSVPKEQIRDMIKWLDDHWDEDYVPRVYKADDLFTRWRQFCDAKRRWERDGEREGTDGEEDGHELIVEIGNWLFKNGWWSPFDRELPMPNQDMIDKALIGMGRKPGIVCEGDVRGG